ncbi:hypothetical protein LTR12_013786 [Friedmanniomyces endolithicus]|nr:hypothetical protein LTR74_002304 [Friedmanniomyces endolithicus]KAK1811832.1 hypothetical protein LTR12_013786 [Friedmanniomyces endolithicus]
MATRNPVHVLDDYYLAITLIITVVYQLIGFSIAFSLKFDKLTDFMGGTNFVWLAIITLAMSGTTEARQVVVSIFIMLWAARLSGFLFFRILKTGKDDRFDDKRDKFFPFLGFWVFQMLWVWIVSFPVTILNSPAVLQYPQPKFGQATDIVGTIIFILGFGLEAVADLQKYLFKQSETGKVPGAVCNVGFFKYSRHPNYFGEIMVQLSLFIIAITPASSGTIPQGTGAYAALYSSILGLFLLTGLLMGLSGLTLQERPGAKKRYEKGIRWPEYEKWLNETSIMFPMPPVIWRNLPVIVKRTVGLEWPIYVFDPAKHADQSKVQERRAEEGEQHLTAAERASDEPARD